MGWGRARKDKATALRMVAAINAHDPEAVGAIVAEDAVYIDSWREGVAGRENIVAGVRVLFAIDPAFAMEVEKISYKAPYVLMRGKVISSRPQVGRRAVWRARCEGGKLLEWQAWAEGKPPRMVRPLLPDRVVDMSERAGERPDEG
jgi:ketosteroid isomerase-like protein